MKRDKIIKITELLIVLMFGLSFILYYQDLTILYYLFFGIGAVFFIFDIIYDDRLRKIRRETNSILNFMKEKNIKQEKESTKFKDKGSLGIFVVEILILICAFIFAIYILVIILTDESYAPMTSLLFIDLMILNIIMPKIMNLELERLKETVEKYNSNLL